MSAESDDFTVEDRQPVLDHHVDSRQVELLLDRSESGPHALDEDVVGNVRIRSVSHSAGTTRRYLHRAGDELVAAHPHASAAPPIVPPVAAPPPPSRRSHLWRLPSSLPSA